MLNRPGNVDGEDLSLDVDQRHAVARRNAGGSRRARRFLTSVAVVCLAYTGCAEDSGSTLRELPVRPATPPPEAIAAQDATPRPGGFLEAIAGTRITSFAAGDGVQLVGRSFGEEYDRPTGVLLLHRSDSDMRNWEQFGVRLMEEGYAVLSFDFRGSGQSVGQADPEKYPSDVEAGLDLLQIFGVTRVAIVGSEVGGTAALGINRRYFGILEGIVTISSQPTFESLDVSDPAKDLNDRVLVLGNEDALTELLPEATFEQVDVGSEPETNAAVLDHVHTFIEDTLGRA